jgi:hypothetical protein
MTDRHSDGERHAWKPRLELDDSGAELGRLADRQRWAGAGHSRGAWQLPLYSRYVETRRNSPPRDASYGVSLHDRSDIASTESVLSHVAGQDYVAVHHQRHVLSWIHRNDRRPGQLRPDVTFAAVAIAARHAGCEVPAPRFQHQGFRK